MTQQLPELTNFTFPAGDVMSAQFHDTALCADDHKKSVHEWARIESK